MIEFYLVVGLLTLVSVFFFGIRLGRSTRKRDAELRELQELRKLRVTMHGLLDQFLERDRLGMELSQLEQGASLGELPALLDAIARRCGFSSVVLSDDVGLPLASNTSALDVEVLAGTASFLLTLVDRAERSRAPKPQSVVVLDQSNQHVLHRIFTVDSSLFTLTAVSRGLYIAPGALDGALVKLERTLAKKVA